MICVKHSYPEAPHYVSGTLCDRNDCSFLVISQPPTIIELVDDNDDKMYLVITNNYDERLYPVT